MNMLGPILHSFFEDHLKVQKGLRQASIKSYRDALLLFLHFVSHDARRKISRLSLADLTCERVIGFLEHLEQGRRNCVSTRNQRLAALHTFFEYAAGWAPEMLLEVARVEDIPAKRTPPPETHYLERDEVQALFASLPANGHEALRDRALLLFLYNTGARVQEVADIRVENLELGSKPRVRLHGKGGKWRICPLWDETASILIKLLAERGDDALRHLQGRPSAYQSPWEKESGRHNPTSVSPRLPTYHSCAPPGSWGGGKRHPFMAWTRGTGHDQPLRRNNRASPAAGATSL